MPKIRICVVARSIISSIVRSSTLPEIISARLAAIEFFTYRFSENYAQYH